MSNQDYLKQERLQNLRHSLAHLFAAALLKLHPRAKITIGPPVEDGFYYDFDLDEKLTLQDLPKIEKEMRKILPAWDKFERMDVTSEQAKAHWARNQYKLELIDELISKGEKITFYKSGDFVDLCRGGHVENPRRDIKPDAFKLTKIAGAYWRGSEKNKMLTRVYGAAFETKAELDEHLKLLAEAEKRDHRKIGQQMGLFTISETVGRGLPLFAPKGALVRELFSDYGQSLLAAKGWQKVWSPHITKNDLYKISGHWDKFGGELFLVKSQETDDELVMKPMNCPHHQQIYASKPRSYRELPIKYMETTTVYRDEKAGELLGLSRVRAITQDDSHTFCTLDQIEKIYQELIEVTKKFYRAIGMKIRARLSFRDSKAAEKYLGEPALWAKAQEIILKIAQKNKLDYFVAEGEAAFYGPKIDFMATDALGREWQLATPQLDFVQPKRFGLIYKDRDGTDQTPVMIHFALMGSIERFLSVYIEHTAGTFPLWLAPVQVVVMPISKKQNVYAKKVIKELSILAPHLRVEIDDRDESVGKKIRDASLQKIPYMIILGEKEVKSAKGGPASGGKISVRTRDGKDSGAMSLKKFVEKLRNEIEKKK